MRILIVSANYYSHISKDLVSDAQEQNIQVFPILSGYPRETYQLIKLDGIFLNHL